MALKRLRTEAFPSTVILNVGGRKFEVGTTTLSKILYFEPLLSGRFPIGVDGVFIDRDPELFAVVLQAVRVNRRPPRQVLDRFGAMDIEDEARYFCVDWLADSLSGKLSRSLAPAANRSIWAEEEIARRHLDELPAEVCDVLLDVHRVETSALDLEWNGPLLFGAAVQKTQREIPSYQKFLVRMDAFAGGGLVEALKGIPGICIAGGAVTGALLEEVTNDIDVFVTSHAHAEYALRRIYEAVKMGHTTRYGQKAKLLITRSRNAVTIYRLGSPMPPVQVITSTYRCTSDLLLRFDVDCCALAWEPMQGRVVATKRSLQAIRTHVNVADSAFETSSYVSRLEKYARRGFSIFIPGLDLSLVRDEILNGAYTFYDDLSLLLKMKETEPGPIDVCAGRVKASSFQRGAVVKGVERLLVMHWGNFKTTRVERSKLMHAGCRGQFWVLHGLRSGWTVSETDIEDDDLDDAVYRRPPACIVEQLMYDALHIDLRAEDLDMELGGAVPANRKCGRNISMALKAACSSEKQSAKLSFVFDFAHGETQFEDLKYMHDAAREPLSFRDLGADAFEQVYGISQKLTFTRGQPRRVTSIDWFSCIY